ncbi:YkgJ family cysteine cluster protein [Desulfocastanea catecholica]
MTTEQVACRKCGNCCKQGGPALHSQDLERIKSGKIPVSGLITFRKGELASNPLTGKIQPVAVELVKIAGTGRQWACCYYDAESGCTVYADRPHACRVLKCWDTRELLALVEKDTLSRCDILEIGDPLVAAIREHERICPCDDLGCVQANFGRLSEEQKNELEKRVRADLRFRTRAIGDFQLNVREELFYFGRPLFQLLQQLGVRIFETPAGIHLSWDK